MGILGMSRKDVAKVNAEIEGVLKNIHRSEEILEMADLTDEEKCAVNSFMVQCAITQNRLNTELARTQFSNFRVDFNCHEVLALQKVIRKLSSLIITNH